MSDEQRHPDHERVKARLKAESPEQFRFDREWDDIAASAIRLGARAPDPREHLKVAVEKMIEDAKVKLYTVEYTANTIVDFVLDNAPKEG